MVLVVVVVVRFEFEFKRYLRSTCNALMIWTIWLGWDGLGFVWEGRSGLDNCTFILFPFSRFVHLTFLCTELNFVSPRDPVISINS